MKRQTLQKTLILETLDRMGNHPTPAEVYEEIHKTYPSISQATVFRVLAGECDEGNAQKVYTAGGATRYEYGTRKHYHISCRLCGKVADVEMPYLDGIENSVTDSFGFTIEKHYIEFVGICPECKSKGNTDKNI